MYVYANYYVQCYLSQSAFSGTVSTRRTSLVDPAPTHRCTTVLMHGGGGSAWLPFLWTSTGESQHS